MSNSEQTSNRSDDVGKGRVLSRVGREGKARNAGSATGDSCGHLAKQKDGNRAKSLNKRLDPD